MTKPDKAAVPSPRGERESAVNLVLKVICPDCFQPHDAAVLGMEIRCAKCGRDFRAQADGENASRIISVTPDELDNVPYSQRSVEIPVNSVSSVIVADPTLLNDKLLRDAPLKEGARWVGKVRLLKKLGQGGMGAVYRGYDESLALDVAVKILPMPMGERDTQFIERFRQEARISAKINHPNVVRTLQVEDQGDIIYLVMDFVEGQTARNLVDTKGPLAAPLALQIIEDAARGMQAAHQHGVIHRDIKPDNILVADDGRVLITDLGLAKAGSAGGHASRIPVTRLGLLLGTPEYMSPEQWEIGGDVGPASDIWSMGATLWMLLTHQPPYPDRDVSVLARNIKETPLPDLRKLRPNLPESVIEILHRCLEKDPTDRFASGTELIAAIHEALNNLALPPGAQKPVTFARRVDRPGSGIRKAGSSQSLPATAAAVPVQAQPAPGIYAPPPPPPTRKIALIGVPVLLAAVGGTWGIVSYQKAQEAARIAAARPAVSIDLHCSTRVKPGEDAELSVTLNAAAGPDAYSIIWMQGDKAYTGASVRVPLDHDAEFVLAVRDKNTGRAVLQRSVAVAVDLQVRAAALEFYSIEAGSPLKLEGQVRGGAGEAQLEARWIDTERPNKSLVDGSLLEVAELRLEPGRYTLALQARRKDKPDWNGAETDRVIVEVRKRIPPEYTETLAEVRKVRESAAQAVDGESASRHWQRAITLFEKAARIFPEGDALNQAEACRRNLSMEQKYMGLLADGRKQRVAAEQLPDTDGVRKLAALSDATRPLYAALTLFERTEARAEVTAIEAKRVTLSENLQSAEQQRVEFDTLIAKARHSTSEAQKFLKPGVALPHWEEAVKGFETLVRKFPKRAHEFTLELREAQENRDKAYLVENFGVVPAKPEDSAAPKK